MGSCSLAAGDNLFSVAGGSAHAVCLSLNEKEETEKVTTDTKRSGDQAAGAWACRPPPRPGKGPTTAALDAAAPIPGLWNASSSAREDLCASTAAASARPTGFPGTLLRCPGGSALVRPCLARGCLLPAILKPVVEGGRRDASATPWRPRLPFAIWPGWAGQERPAHPRAGAPGGW